MSTMLSDMAEQVGGGGGHSGVAPQTKDAIVGVKDAVKADAQEAIADAEDWVIEHPLKSLCIAAGVGFILGVLWAR
jgi:ElaB/YqjD/DUF883 family membrane-anchored ribosome-binding protein